MYTMKSALHIHYSDVIISGIASQITGVSIVCLAVCSGGDQRKHQGSTSLAFVKGIQRWPANSPHKGPVTRKMFPFDDVIMSKFNGMTVVDPRNKVNNHRKQRVAMHWRIFCYCLHRKLSFWKYSVQPLTKISSKCHFRFSVISTLSSLVTPEVCPYENFQCYQWRQIWHHGDSPFSVTYLIRFATTALFSFPWWRHQMETFPRYWPFVRGIHRSQVNSPHKGLWRGALMFSLKNKRLSKQPRRQ